MRSQNKLKKTKSTLSDLKSSLVASKFSISFAKAIVVLSIRVISSLVAKIAHVFQFLGSCNLVL